MSKKELLTAALVASMALPGVGLAAIDDKGMAYVSASEGFSGRIQMRWSKTDDVYKSYIFGPDDVFIIEDNDKGTLGLETLRLYLDGNIDIGGSMKSTYHAEIRNDGSSGIKLHAYDIGITGAFGSLNVGRLDGVTDRMVPGGSLDTVAGSKAESITSYPDDHGLRYESPSFLGMKLGASLKANGSGGPPGSIDGYNAAIRYEHPIGLQVGFGVENKKGLDFIDNTLGNYDVDQKGYRLGARYSLAGFTLGYEHRRMDSFNAFGHNSALIPFINLVDANPTLTITYPNTNQTDEIIATRWRYMMITAFDSPQASYKADRIALKYRFDRITASVNYSKEKALADHLVTELDRCFIVRSTNGCLSSGDTVFDDPSPPAFGGLYKALNPTRTVLGVDLSYSLGTKSRIAVGIVKEESEEVNVDTDFLYVTDDREVDKVILDYQVNF